LASRKPFRFQIPQPPRGGQRAVVLKSIHMAYDANRVYTGLDLIVERGEQTVLVGPNGAGKSTLLKILAGAVEFQQGEREVSHNSKIGYFSQHRAATLDPERTVLEEVSASAPLLREEEARAVLGSFMFRKDDIYKPTKVLSGGEKTRLNLIKFLVDPPNLLLMDEPTTHLDILTVESLTLALERYEGTLVFISHDVHFIRRLATKVLHVNAGQITAYCVVMIISLRKPARWKMRVQRSRPREPSRQILGATTVSVEGPRRRQFHNQTKSTRCNDHLFKKSPPPQLAGSGCPTWFSGPLQG
jgi:ATP-binding cassette, subfamily F, member 3